MRVYTYIYDWSDSFYSHFFKQFEQFIQLFAFWLFFDQRLKNTITLGHEQISKTTKKK